VALPSLCAHYARGLLCDPTQSSSPRDSKYLGSELDPRTSPANKSDVRRAAANPVPPVLPCGPKRATPDAAPQPRAESETVCCRPADEDSAAALLRSNR